MLQTWTVVHNLVHVKNTDNQSFIKWVKKKILLLIVPPIGNTLHLDAAIYRQILKALQVGLLWTEVSSDPAICLVSGRLHFCEEAFENKTGWRVLQGKNPEEHQAHSITEITCTARQRRCLLPSNKKKNKIKIKRQFQADSGPHFPGTSTLSVSLSDRTPPWYQRHKPVHLSKSLQTPETLTRLLAENGFLVEIWSESTKSSLRIEAANTTDVLRPKLTGSH